MTAWLETHPRWCDLIGLGVFAACVAVSAMEGAT